MKKRIKLFLLATFILVLMMPLSTASSLDVKITENKELAFHAFYDESGWQDSQIEITNDKGELVYTFRDYLLFTNGETVQLLNCPECRPGDYFVKMNVYGEQFNAELKTKFTIEKKEFDWFWIISLVLIILLVLTAIYTFGKHKKQHKQIISEHKTKSKPKHKKVS